MTSHEYARQLRELAEFLESITSFGVPDYTSSARIDLNFFSEKNLFLNAVKILGTGEKNWDSQWFFEFRKTLPSGAQLALSVNRDAICRKVQEEKWECEPLLSADELESIGGAA